MALIPAGLFNGPYPCWAINNTPLHMAFLPLPGYTATPYTALPARSSVLYTVHGTPQGQRGGPMVISANPPLRLG